MAGPIPVINLADFPNQSKKLTEACEEWGCFRIINHKIPDKMMMDMKKVVRSLSDRPIEIKQRNTHVIMGSGYLPNSEGNPLYEAFGCYDMGSPDSIENFCTQLDASPEQSEIIKAYTHALHELLMEMARKIGESIGLSYELGKGWLCQLRLNKYSFTEETLGSTGLQIHCDSGFLTILQQDDCVGGLEVIHKTSGEFVSVDFLPGSLLVNLGEIAAAWSNGKFWNVKHRVQCKETTTRVSMAMFLLGPKLEAVEAPPEFVDSKHPRLYAPIIYDEYRELRLIRGFRAGEALEHMLLKPDIK